MSDLRARLQAVIAQWREEADRLENRYGFSPNDVIRGAFMAEVQRLRYCAAELESLLSADPPQAPQQGTKQIVAGYDAEFWHQSYTLLSEAVLTHLPDCVRDDDVAEEAIFVEAIETAGKRLQERTVADPQQAQETWQPIATAPKGSWPKGPDDTRDPAYVPPPRLWLTLKDGQRCVGCFDAYYAEGGAGFDGNPPWVEEFSGERVNPTHWMPLPAPPVTGDRAPAGE